MSDNQINFVETRVIELPKGGTLTIQLTQELIDQIRSRFNLGDEPLTDDSVRMFLWGAVNNAIEKVELN